MELKNLLNTDSEQRYHQANNPPASPEPFHGAIKNDPSAANFGNPNDFHASQTQKTFPQGGAYNKGYPQPSAHEWSGATPSGLPAVSQVAPTNGVPSHEFVNTAGLQKHQFQHGASFIPDQGYPQSSSPHVSSSQAHQLLTDTQAALKTIQRFKNGELKNEVAVRDSQTLGHFPEVPTLITSDAYPDSEVKSNFPNAWRPDNLAKVLSPEISIRDQKSSKDMKRSIVDFRNHLKNLPAEDEIWHAKEIPLMHHQNCINSKKNRHCMGCSPYWKSIQNVVEELKPWGNYDMLHFEQDHTETLMGYISMNGSFTSQRREMLHSDLINTMYYADDPNAISIWGFVHPSEASKLTEEDCLGYQFLNSSIFVDPSTIEKKAKVIYAIQKVGQTMVVPAMWSHFVIRMGRGLMFSASWNLLRLKNICNARRAVELNRGISLYKPVNLASLVISGAYQKMDELDTVETPQEKNQIIDFLWKVLPVLKTVVLEELLGESVHLSSAIIAGYDSIVEQLKRNGKQNFAAPFLYEISQLRSDPINTNENVVEEDDDMTYYCGICKYVLFNTRRSCLTCKNLHLCENCFGMYGKDHPHKMKKQRKQPLASLIDLVSSIRVVLSEHEHREVEVVPQVQPPTAQLGRRKREHSETHESAPESYEEEVIDCICGNNKDLGFMISCEKCLAWLHGKCVGISKRNEPDVYYCPRCVKKTLPGAKLSPKGFSPQEKLREYKLVS